MKRKYLIILILPLLGVLLNAQVSSATKADRLTGGRFSLLSFTLAPFMSIPLGADTAFLGMGGGSGLGAEFRLPFLPILYTGAQFDYGYISTPDPATSLSAIELAAITGVHLQLLPSLSLKIFGTAGFFYSVLNSPGGTSGSNPAFSGGLRLDFDLIDSLGIGIEGAYRYYGGLFNDLAVRLTGIYKVPAFSAAFSGSTLPPGYIPLEHDGRGLKIIGYKATPIFPVFSNYYDTHAFAELSLRNFENVPAESVKVTAVVKGYMDNPRPCSIALKIAPGANATTQVFALFNDKLLETAETTKLALTLVVEYQQYNNTYREEYAPSVEVLYRNAMTWDDDRKIAAFISSRDPAAFGFTRGVLAAARTAFNPSLSQDLQSAMLIWEALRAYGISYTKDPSSALTANNKTVIDSLQFPQQTLQYKSGDCDDLSILFCSLLESIGIETAIITIPGHVYAAMLLDVLPEDAQRYLGKAGDFIIRDNQAWLPVEVTGLTADFLWAWKEGAREWNDPKEGAAFYPTHDAWTIYAPVVVSGTAGTPVLPKAAALNTALKNGLQALLDRELTPRADTLLAESKKAGAREKSLNALGVLYARYGLYDKAEEQFKAVSAKINFTPTAINLANLYLVRKQYKQAIAQFQKVLSTIPDNSSCLLGAALAADRMGDSAAVKGYYDKLKAGNAKLAERYAYLDAADAGGANRAASNETSDGQILWEEE